MNDLAGHLAIASGACAFVTLIVVGIRSLRGSRSMTALMFGVDDPNLRERLALALNLLAGRPTAYGFVFEQGKLVVRGDGAVITHCVFTGDAEIEVPVLPDVPESRTAPAVEKWLET